MLTPLPAVFLESSMSKAAAEQTFVFNSLLIKKSITRGSIQKTVCDKCFVTVLSGTNIIYSIVMRTHLPVGWGLQNHFAKSASL